MNVLLLDSKSILYRGYYAFKDLSTTDGVEIGACFGFLKLLILANKKFKPDLIIAVWDPKGGDKFRAGLYPEYKANRKRARDEFYSQIPITKDFLSSIGIANLEVMGVEADDVLGTLAKSYLSEAENINILTGDRDFLQLIDDKITISLMRRGLSDVINCNTDYLVDKYGFNNPKKIIFLKSLMGDSSDNIPGAKGIGEKTALKLISEYENLKDLYSNLDKVENIKLREKLIASTDLSELSEVLATIRTNLDLDFSLDKSTISNKDKLIELINEYQFKSIEKDLISLMTNPNNNDFRDSSNSTNTESENSKKFNIECIEESNVDLITNNSRFAILDIESKLYAFCMTCITKKEKIHYKELSKNETDKSLLKLLNNKDKSIYGLNIKEILKKYYPEARVKDIKAKLFDIGLIQAVVDSNYRFDTLEQFTSKYIGLQTDIEDNGLFKDVEEELEATNKAKTDNLLNFNLIVTELEKQLNNDINSKNIYDNIEMPLIPILGQIENYGIKVDTTKLEELSHSIAKYIEEKQKEIYELVGEEFNILSPKQLQAILKKVIDLSSNQLLKNKIGFSVSAKQLEKLKSTHPVIDKVIEYREYTKLQSTYLQGLIKSSITNNNQTRIHTTYHQIGSATARISSNNPNLQNIPNRSQFSKQIRQAFEADKGNVLLSVDYSQIELRLAAILSKDPVLIENFLDNRDIHTETAAKVLDISSSDVTKEQRSQAKAINFGIIYGLSAHGLSEGTGMNIHESSQFIDRYFSVFSGLKTYLDFLKDFAHKHQYTETIFSRKRYCPEINSSVYLVRQAQERAAINFPFQGSNSDIIKLAISKLANNLPEYQILLQIHDELIFEVKESEVELAIAQIEELMVSVLEAEIKLKVDFRYGKTWGDLEDARTT